MPIHVKHIQANPVPDGRQRLQKLLGDRSFLLDMIITIK